MTISRRTVLASAALATPLAAHAAQGSPWLRPSLTAETAPDAISRHILGQRITDLNCGATVREAFPAAFDRGFAQLIDQNFAERDVAATAELIDGMSDVELSDLAQLYVNATTAHGRPEKLMFVLAHRLDGRRLGRVARHFGFGRTYHAVHAIAPGKAQGARGFLNHADTGFNGPVPGYYGGPYSQVPPDTPTADGLVKMTLRRQAPGWRMTPAARYTEFLHHTPTQIYQAMRTAKYGSLSVEGALLEAASIMSGGLGRAWFAGSAFGYVVVRPVVEFYMPGFYIGLGDWIGPTVDKMIDAWNFPDNKDKKKDADETGAANFLVRDPALGHMRNSGGDFGSVSGLMHEGRTCPGCPLFDPL